MTRDTKNGMLGGVLAGISNSTDIPLSLLRVLFLVGFFAIGGITFGISA